MLRAGLVVLLLGGAYLAARRWLECAFPLGLRSWSLDFSRICTFGSGNPAFDQTGPGPLWPYLIVAAIYIIAAAYVALGRVTIARREGRAT